jgi:hypothetical protein
MVSLILISFFAVMVVILMIYAASHPTRGQWGRNSMLPP